MTPIRQQTVHPKTNKTEIVETNENGTKILTDEATQRILEFRREQENNKYLKGIDKPKREPIPVR